MGQVHKHVGPGSGTAADIYCRPGALTHLWFVQACRRILGPGESSPAGSSCDLCILIPNTGLIPYSKTGVAMMEVSDGRWAVSEFHS